MAEIQNELVILTGKTIEGLKQTEAGLTKVDNAVKQVGTASTQAFSGKDITDYQSKVAKLSIELQKQKDLVVTLGKQETETIALQKSGIRGLETELQKIQKEREKAVASQIQLKKEIKETEKAVKNQNAAHKEINTTSEKSNVIFTQLKNTILATFTITAVIKGFKEAMNSSETTADKLKAVMEGLHFASTRFFQSIANADFSNLITSLREAYERGMDYADMLDLLEKRQVALDYLTTEEAIKANDLEMIWRNQTKTITERTKAGNEWKDLVEQSYNRQIDQAKLVLDADLKALNIKGKEVGEIRALILEYVNLNAQQVYLRQGAGAVNEEYKTLTSRLKELQSIPITQEGLNAAGFTDVGQVRNAITETKKQIQILELRNDTYARFATLIRLFEDKNKESLITKAIGSAGDVNKAIVAFDQGTKRASSMINSLLIKSDKLESKEAKAALKARDDRVKEMNDFEKSLDDKVKIEKDSTDKIIDYETKEYLKKETKKTEIMMTNEKNRTDIAIDEAKKKAAEDKRIADQNAKDKKEIERATMQTISNLANSFYSYKQTLDDAAKQKELIAAGDNAAKIKEINNKYAEKEKSRAISQAWINAILGATNAVATANNIYAGIILAAGILAEAALYTAEIQAQPVSFSKGVIKLKRGKFKQGVDTIPAYLNENESVMTAEETAENEDLFNAIRQGKRDDYIHKNFVIPEINKEYINTMKKKSDSKESEMIRQIITTGIKAELDDYKIRQKLLLLIESGDRNTERLISELQKTKKVR